MNNNRKTSGPSPELKANFCSILTWYWLQAFVSKGNKNTIEAEDLYDMNPRETTEYCENKWKNAIQNAKHGGSQLTVLRLLWDCFGIEYMKAALFKPVWLVSVVLQVYILKEMLKTVAHTEKFKWWWGTLLVLGMFAMSVVSSLSHHMCFALSQKVGMKIRSTVSMAVFSKLLNTKLVSLIGMNSGEMLNLITNDTQKLLDTAMFFNFVLFSVVEVLTVSVLVIVEAGVSGVPGVLLAILSQPLQIWLARKSGRLRQKAIQYTDKRVHLTREVVSGIRVIKYNGWVLPFLQHILDLRYEEMSKITKSAYIRSSTSTIRDSVIPLASLVTFGTYYGIHGGNFMPATQAFTVLALFSVLVRTFAIAPLGIQVAGEAIVAIRRLQKFLNLDKENSSGGTDVQFSKDKALLAVNCSFSWVNDSTKNISCDVSKGSSRRLGSGRVVNIEIENESETKSHNKQETDMLYNINLSVDKGETIGIYGPVGSGKSSLLLAILDEMKRLNGNAFVERDIAYVPQQPWILNDTVRQNILFTNHFDPERYQRTVAACALDQDISQFVGGHDAEIGERGINLSGGQKARISLARACYSSAPVILLDDPFAAVDVTTANHLIKHVLKGIIKGRTIILVTHNRPALNACDRVFSMDNGHLAEISSLKENTNEAVSVSYTENTSMEDVLDGESSSDDNEEHTEAEKPEYEIFEARPDEAKGRTTLTEKSVEGHVQISTWLTYAKESGGFIFFSFVMLVFLVGQSVRVMVDYWLRVWTERMYNLKSEIYLASFACFTVGATIFCLVRAILFTKATMIAARQLHKRMAERVLRAPQLFFDQNVAGRILNRFSKDQALTDELLPNTAQQMLEFSVQSLGSLIIIAVLIPWFLLVFPPFIVIFYYVQRRYVTISRELKRLEATTRSPVYAHFSQTLQGIVSVRSYGTQPQMHKAFISLIDANHRPFIIFLHLQRWLGVWLDFATCLCVTVAAILVIVLRNSISPGLAGVALVQSLQVTQFVQFAVRQLAETENLLTSVERIEEYANLPSEASPTTEPGIIGKIWPSRGEVEFKDYTLTYRTDLPPILNKISFKVNPAEKIGILGRTGAGKSSLIAALFRMVENEKCSGDIYIDNVNVKLVGLDDLRQRLSIIPQDPILFQGTIRFNLDPFQEFPDTEIYEALESVHLTEKIQSLNKGLDSEVAQNGENFSLGQRQLICLARSLLRRSRIIVMDEATASVDGETDSLIQKTIRTMFTDCTVLTIAHRIDTVIDCDRLLIMKAGVIAEFDSPLNLLDNHEDGVFSEMVRQTGPILSQKLYEAARTAASAASNSIRAT